MNTDIENRCIEGIPLELTIEITNYCPEHCNFCSSNASKYGEYLDYNSIIKFLESYSNIDIINISGGEPLSHPDFYKILLYCKSRAKKVWVYSNAIENLAYNTHILREINIKANVCLEPNNNSYIPKGSFVVNLLRYIKQGRATKEEINIRGTSLDNSRCFRCRNKVLMANNKVADSPCKKGSII